MAGAVAPVPAARATPVQAVARPVGRVADGAPVLAVPAEDRVAAVRRQVGQEVAGGAVEPVEAQAAGLGLEALAEEQEEPGAVVEALVAVLRAADLEGAVQAAEDRAALEAVAARILRAGPRTPAKAAASMRG